MKNLINLTEKILPQIKPKMNDKKYIIFTWGITLSAIFYFFYGINCAISAMAGFHAGKYVLMIPLFTALILTALTAIGILIIGNPKDTAIVSWIGFDGKLQTGEKWIPKEVGNRFYKKATKQELMDYKAKEIIRKKEKEDKEWVKNRRIEKQTP